MKTGKKIYTACDGTQRKKGGDTMRNNLYLFRHEKRLSQQEIADKIGCSRATYSSIESGSRNGRVTFWDNLQRAFGLTDAKKGELMKLDEKQS